MELKTSQRFNAVCRVVQAHRRRAELPNWVFRLVQNAAYFQFPGHSALDLPNEKIFAEGADAVSESFFLPFRQTVVEDDEKIVFLEDSEEKQEGLAGSRKYVVAFYHTNADSDKNALVFEWGSIESGAFTNSAGPIESPKWGTRLGISLHGGMLATKKEIIQPLDGFSASDFTDPNSQTIIRNVSTLVGGALRVIAYFNMPNRFIFEVGPVKPEPDHGAKIKWGEVRPRFTLLTPGEIKRVLGVPDDADVEAEIARSPHPRRAHKRKFRSDRYKASGLFGTSILIPATWVGPSEAVIGQRLYRVHLDR